MTVQLRRYEVGADRLDAFVVWWREHLVPARRAAGFEIEFACAVPASGEFVWAVSTPGGPDGFARAERVYVDSPERSAAMAALPAPIASGRVDAAITVTAGGPVRAERELRRARKPLLRKI
ncbi:hypothetical protein [Agromyces kandeliae]|uniref:NIPSNAP domain-containing protein n=1 Tax=Agromyces kandeliae TaxID=2666141 RepID=A0A6L5R718_9MICO|nr:hypothetical protein [Agromyces kandeliae]MRX45248.1 hypothetical protein [Agromyces kandeliae]